eukprot:TRINITY_DN23929_c0_g1_i1.p1 TRINITY_DN23929_c0_g1~~TRINITY_DN23929_c0_g1_i1.p1  ORF type:complete len:356 (+),score=64.83 TRINITY_DN23929_c0_g1_i1:120-1187(+)
MLEFSTGKRDHWMRCGRRNSPCAAVAASMLTGSFLLVIISSWTSAFVIGHPFGTCPRSSAGLPQSRIIRQFFQGEKIVKGAPPLPASRMIPSELEEEYNGESATKYPRQEQGFASSLNVQIYPHPALRRKNVEVTVFDENLKEFVKGMLKRMKQGNGCGMSAPHVGVNLRIIVMNVDKAVLALDPLNPDRKFGNMIFINPKIEGYSDQFEYSLEDSFATMEIAGEVKRSKKVFVSALDLDGKPIKYKLDQWFMARVFQSMYDQLDGVMFIDRLEPEAQEDVKPRLDEMLEIYLSKFDALYEALELKRGTPANEVKKVYRKLVLQYHPDKNLSDEDILKFKGMQKAYKALAEKLGI